MKQRFTASQDATNKYIVYDMHGRAVCLMGPDYQNGPTMKKMLAWLNGDRFDENFMGTVFLVVLIPFLIVSIFHAITWGTKVWVDLYTPTPPPTPIVLLDIDLHGIPQHITELQKVARANTQEGNDVPSSTE